MEQRFYGCPVCGYGLLQSPPANHSICPCCGTEFGYDDFTKSHRQLRDEWLRSGAYWFSSSTVPPVPFWNGFRQVIEAGLPIDVQPPRPSIQQIKISTDAVPLPKLTVVPVSAA